MGISFDGQFRGVGMLLPGQRTHGTWDRKKVHGPFNKKYICLKMYRKKTKPAAITIKKCRKNKHISTNRL